MSWPARTVDDHGRAAFDAIWSPWFQGQVGFAGEMTCGGGRGELRGNWSPSGAVRRRVARGESVTTGPFFRLGAPGCALALGGLTWLVAEKFRNRRTISEAGGDAGASPGRHGGLPLRRRVPARARRRAHRAVTPRRTLSASSSLAVS